ncbi:PREDICTED: venom protease-like [Nicrophorus vespilloides]|uniref:Venom protease-like n=1 Tax=Nicrophorus vespilloides TaxID=110193 RepID=A0ABM1NIH3_NICVS|nr:PREDICTED: venom protease-like [Nicrophorus vespilloides]
MFNVNSLTVIITINLVISHGTVYLGDLCDFDDGSTGFCVGIKECKEAIKLLNVSVALKVCNYDQDYPIVCCNDKDVKIPGVKSLKYCDEINVRKRSGLLTVGGGKPSLAKEFPHMAALGYSNNEDIIWGCGGSLISLKFVLTAGHCLQNIEFGPVKHVRLGDLNLKSNTDDASPQSFFVARTYKHPNYVRPSKYHDIGLIELDREAKKTSYVKAACLNIREDANEDKFLATGWGELSFHGAPADHLQKIQLREMNNSQCNNHYKINKRLYNKGISPSMQICAGDPGKDTCKGDSGGPLQQYNKKYIKAFDIHGVTSFGKACLLTSSPAVYTRVSYYIDWIESIVWP